MFLPRPFIAVVLSLAGIGVITPQNQNGKSQNNSQGREKLPFGISDSDVNGPTIAGVRRFSEESMAYLTGVGVRAGTFAAPYTTQGTRYTAIFSFDDWRVAAYCDSGSLYAMHPCHEPKQNESWIRVRKDGYDLSVLFVDLKKPRDRAEVEKMMNSKMTAKVDLWHIIFVRNLKTGEIWPKPLEEETRK